MKFPVSRRRVLLDDAQRQGCHGAVGTPVEFRVVSTNVGAQTSVSQPGRVRFVPSGGGPDAFSFQWVEPNQSAGVHVDDLRLQWRSPSGGAVTLLRGDTAVSYDTEAGACVGSS